VVGFGIWLAVARGRWRLGALLAAASVLLLAVDLRYVVPYFRGESYPHLQRYTYLGSSLGDILMSIAVRPWRWIGIVLTGPRLVYLLQMRAPLGFLSLLAPRALMAAVPGLAMNLLSTDPVLFNFRSQYQSFVLPFFVLAAVDGYTRIRAWRRAPTLLGLAFFASVLLTARTANDLMVSKWWLNADDHAAYALMRQIPATAAVSANERLAPHLATRRQIFFYPAGLGVSQYVLEIEPVLREDPARGYREIARDSGWILLRRD
jgi:uncharacterized membrane protein